ncbi:Membrane protein involved in the export of O-antigen and teichoic acid [Novosphingobium sp. CF614]|uniref:oligosaccharide flippase family protein n=1 Tax=Novosphingobium sp. CF614 TaxID=1884364 RepID=UPI0008ED323A|nr:oligosaccharide flippase family protein [Novosphingobium sp. CF614]SFG20026.1 Membrane protein involved in the export of O-antigen and teichoic acid [Novosphingobium sp. CF614]
MHEARVSIGGKSVWTIVVYAASAAIRFLTNIILTRLLAPEILGVVVIAQAIRTGAELLTDMGMEQNVVHSPHGDDERFLNTVWTLQILRGIAIAAVTIFAAYAVSRFYRVDTAVLVAMSAAPFLNSLASTSIFSLSRHLEVKTKNLFELASEAAGLIINVTLALWLHSVWAPIMGILATLAVRSAASYLLPHQRHRLLLDRTFGQAIFEFSKWVMLSSLMLFGAVYADRLFLGHVASLAVLGIYGLARALSDVPSMLATRLAMQIVFPTVAKDQTRADAAARTGLARTRRYVLLLFAVGIATVMAWSDWTVRLLYDVRYEQAGWMLFLLLASSWFAVLAWFGEAKMLGHGMPRSVGVANAIRLAVMMGGLVAGFSLLGLPGAVLALPASELARYGILRVAQRGLPNTFALQDALFTLGFLALLIAWVTIRVSLGLGVPWALMPHAWPA